MLCQATEMFLPPVLLAGPREPVGDQRINEEKVKENGK